MMTIFLEIEKDVGLWQSTLIRLHMLGFKWHRTGLALDNFCHLNTIIETGGKGLLINLEGKTVCWSRGHHNPCIEVKK